MTFTNKDYTVAWISALTDELAAAQALLDDEHEDLQAVPGDYNAYTLGRIGKHNVVIAGLPRGTMGTISAASVAANLLRSFPNVRFGLMVGVGGGVPDVVRLGDIVVSNPEGQSGGVVQYDFGTATPGGFTRKGILPTPPTVVSTAVTKVSAYARRKGYKFNTFYEEMLAENPRMEDFRRPSNDVLYEREYLHVGAEADCSNCDPLRIIARAPCLESTVYYSLIGSGNSVIRDASQRDLLYEQEGIICFEMEAAGLMKEFPCLVIRGICDYCDTHKNKHWQPYAGGIAAAYAKELLLTIPGYAVAAMPQNELLEAVGQQTLAMKTLNVTGRDAHETAKETHSTIQSINAKLEGSEQRVLEDKDLQCLRSLNAADPRVDKARIEDIKGGLLKDAYKWIMQNQEFVNWHRNGQLLWIRGDPGKGKTMLICGIIDILEDELNSCQSQTSIDGPWNRKLIYFFCQATDNANNSASAVLRGLIYTILQQSPLLIANVRDQLDRCSSMQAANSLYILTDVFETLLEQADFYVLIDALDECTVQRNKLLQIILRSPKRSKARWIVTSRNWNDIRQSFDSNSTMTPQISLELNAESVSQAVLSYINHKVAELSSSHKYDNDLRDFVRHYLLKHAGSTFLWVALVCMGLARLRRYQIRKTLTEYAAGLDEVYDRMIITIEESSNEELLKQVLGIISVVFEPIYLNELPNIMDLPEELSNNMNWLEELISDCGSFLSVRAGRIEFVHQSAKDYIDKRLAGTQSAKAELHIQVYDISIQIMHQKLQRDIYNVQDPGTRLEDIIRPSPDPLAGVRYCCIYSLRHLMASGDNGEHCTITLLPFLRQRFLYWLEAMILLRSLSGAFHLLRELETFAEVQAELKSFAADAYNFASYFREVIAEYPLQLYYTGLVFCPTTSEVRAAFREDLTHEISLLQDTRNFNWPRRYIDIKCKSMLTALRYSHNGLKLAVADVTGMIRLFDAISGEMLQSVLLPLSSEVESSGLYEYPFITDLVFRPNDSLLLVKSEYYAFWERPEDHIILVYFRSKQDGDHRCQFHTWDLSDCQWSIISGIPPYTQLAVADRNAKWIAYWTPLSSDNTNDHVMLLDVRTKANVFSFPFPMGNIRDIVFSADSGTIAVSCAGDYIHVWDVFTGTTICALTSPCFTNHFALCPKGTKAAFVSRSPDQLTVYDTVSGGVIWSRAIYTIYRSTIDFSLDGKALIVRNGCSCSVYNATTGIMQQCFSTDAISEGLCSAFEFSAKYRHIALTGLKELRLFTVDHNTIWTSSERLEKDEDSWWRETVIYCSPFATDFILKNKDEITIWNVQTGAMILNMSQENVELECEILKYRDGYIIAVYNRDGDIEATTKVTLSRLHHHHLEHELAMCGVICLAISRSGSLIVFVDLAGGIHLLNLEDQKTTQLYLGEMRHASKLPAPVFSDHENRVAGVVSRRTSNDYMAVIWSKDTGAQLRRIQLCNYHHPWAISLSPSGQSVYLTCNNSRTGVTSHGVYDLDSEYTEFDCNHHSRQYRYTIVNWCSSTNEELPADRSHDSFPIPSNSQHGDVDLIYKPVMIGIPRVYGRFYARVLSARTVSGARIMINTMAGVFTMAQDGRDHRYGTNTDIYLHDEWIYKNGKQFVWVPRSLRLDKVRSAYASQCLSLFTANHKNMTLKFQLDPGTRKSGDQENKPYEVDDSRSSMTLKETGGTRRIQEYLICLKIPVRT